MRITKWAEYGILCSLQLASLWPEAGPLLSLNPVSLDSNSNESVGGSLESKAENLANEAANETSLVTAQDLADAQNIPLQYTQQILQRLKNGNVIETVRGPKGGYRLARAPELITLKDVLLASEGHTFEVICEKSPIKPETMCAPENFCGLRDVWKELQLVIDQTLSGYTLAKLLKINDSNPLVQIRDSKALHVSTKNA